MHRVEEIREFEDEKLKILEEKWSKKIHHGLWQKNLGNKSAN
jgi:hypothetical protein